MDKKNLIVILFFLSLITIALIISVNITGNAVSNVYSYNSCAIDSDCTGNEVCCLFYGKNEGICDAVEFCPAIEEMTREKESNEGLLLTQTIRKDTSYYVQNSLISLFFILLVLLLSSIIISKKRKIKPSSKNKRKSTRKKSRR